MEKTSRGKRPYVNFNCSVGLKNVSVSLCNKTADERHAELKEAIEQNYECSRERLIALNSLLDELVAVNCISFQEAFDQFAGKVPSIACKPEKKEARRQFKEKILSKNGLPVLFLNNGGHTFILLLELPLNNMSLCRSLDHVLNRHSPSIDEHAGERFETELAAHFSTLMKLLSSSKDRAILTFVLSSMFSSTQLALILGLQNQRTEKLKRTIENFLSEVDKNEEQAESEAQSRLEALISRLQTDLNRCEKEITIKRARLHDEEVENRNFDIEMKRERLRRLQGRSKKDVKKRISRRLFHKWKQSLLSQKGKGRGCYRIDRRAEQAVYEVLQEQLKAHTRRWGDEGTGYLEHEHRIHSKEMLRIANR